MNTDTRINTDTLSFLVTNAAGDWLKRVNPEKAVQYGVTTDPRLGTWDQTHWARAERNGVCQTAFCIAGGAAALNGDEVILMEWNGEQWYSDRVAPLAEAQKVRGVEMRWGFAWLPQDHSMSQYDIPGNRSIRMAGMSALGLEDHEASMLFDGDNTVEQVVSIAVGIAAEHGQVLDVPDWVMTEFFDPEVYEDKVADYS